MAVELATAYVSIAASARGLQQSIAQEMGGPVEKEAARSGDRAAGAFGGRFKAGLKNAVTGAVAVLGAGLAIKSIVGFKNAASDLNETISKSNTIFGQNAGAIEKWAEGAANAIGQSKQQALESAATFGNMFDQLGIGADTAADMSTQMVELASDFASFHNADITQVLEAQSAAFRGEYDAVQRFVPTITAAAVQQKALEMGLADTTSELDAQDKALATQALLMENAGAAAGDFARTSSGLANQERILAANMDNLRAKIGNFLIPVFSAVTSILLTHVIPGFTSAGNVVSAAAAPIRVLADHWDVLKFVVAAAAAVMLPHFVALGVQSTVSAAKQVAAWTMAQAAAIKTAAVHSAQVGAQVARWAFLGVQSLLHAAKVAAAWLIAMGPIAIVAAAVVGLVVLVVKNWDTIKSAITTAATAVLNFLRSNWPLILAIITGPFGLIVLAVVKHWDKIKEATSAAVDAVLGFFRELPGRIIDAVTGAGSKLLDLGKTMVKKIVEGIKGAAGDIGSAILGAIPGGDAISGAIGKLNPFGDGPGRPLPGGGGPALARVQRAIAGTGARITSTYRSPEHNRRVGGSPRSYHMDRTNPAVDIVHSSAAVLDMIYARLRAMGGWRELLWRVPNHAPGDNMHIHAAHAGEFLSPSSPGWLPGLARDERVRVVQVGENIVPKGAAAGQTVNIYAQSDAASEIRREFERSAWLSGAPAA